MKPTACHLVSLALAAVVGACASPGPRAVPDAKGSQRRPNILWISCEDISPHLGCYGDSYAVTPRLDLLARQGVCFDRAFANIGVCAPARSAVITGMYPPSIGSHHMRCEGQLPRGVRFFPSLLRDAGYYCTNNAKTDYNLPIPDDAWDESSGTAHWRNRRPGQPFFAVFNIFGCHESRIRQSEADYRKRTAALADWERHDPARAAVPPYHPDTPEVRRDWARYADVITLMDREVGRILDQLDADGLTEDTIVMFWSDHGAGMPRSKRWLYDSSTRVPLILRVPPKWRDRAGLGVPGTRSDRLVSFVDFAPTMLSLAAVPVPGILQGRAFLGPQAKPPRQAVFGFRDRMDERYDMQRSVRDARFLYIRNFMPHRVYAQHIAYMFQMPTMRVWHERHRAGTLDAVQNRFFETKPVEELYDADRDPHQVRNLAGDPAFANELSRLRQTLRAQLFATHDLGFLPEAELRGRFGRVAPYDAVRQPSHADLIPTLFATASLVGASWDAEAVRRALRADDAARRYWGAMAAVAAGARATELVDDLRARLEDSSLEVAVVAAEACAALGQVGPARTLLARALRDVNVWVRLRAVGVLDRMDQAVGEDLAAALRAARKDPNLYVADVAEKAVRDLDR